MDKPDKLEFEKTESRQVPSPRATGNNATFSFDKVPLSEACFEISEVGGCGVYCSPDVAETLVSGYFSLRNVQEIIPLLAQTNGLRCVETRGAYYLTSLETQDAAANVVRVYRLPPGNQEALLETLTSICGEETASVNVVGSSVVVFAPLNLQDKIGDLMSVLNHNQASTYFCDVYFLRLKYNDYMNLSAKLEVNSGLDLLKGGFDLDELFSLYADGDLSNGRNRVDQRPALLLTDGQETRLTVGSEIVRERRQVSSEGYSSTSGYERFQDGVELSLTPRKLEGGLVSLDVNLSISTFDKNDVAADVVPQSDKASIQTTGLVVRDSKLYYLGSIDRRDESGGLGLFSFNRTRNSDVLTIWARVREIKL